MVDSLTHVTPSDPPTGPQRGPWWELAVWAAVVGLLVLKAPADDLVIALSAMIAKIKL